eukprot:gene4794-5043_t
MLPFITKPNETPREVEIQRKRRLYACQSVLDLVIKEGVDVLQLSQQPLQWDKLAVFDDVTFESRQPEEWVPQTAGIPRAMGGVAAFDETGNLQWSDCLVLDHDDIGSQFLVQLTSAASSSQLCSSAAHSPLGGPLQHRGSCSPAPASSTGSATAAAEEGSKAHIPGTATPFWVPRVQLCFAAEDPAVYAKRFAASCAAMAAAEVQMAFELCIDCMPTDNVPQLTTEQVNRVLIYALNSKKLKDKLMDTMRLPGGYDFKEQLSEFSFKTLLTKTEVIFALNKIRMESNKVLKMCLFNTCSSKSMRLEEFEQLQATSMDAVSNHLKDNWMASIKNIIKSSFEGIGKGWYNLAESNFESYRFSKLRRLMSLVRYGMEDTLRYLAEGSMREFVGFIQASCYDAPSVSPSSPVAASTKPSSRKVPLLQAELLITPDGSDFAYSIPVDSIRSRILAVLDKGISKLQGLPQLEPAVMDQLFWPTVPVLNSVHLQEDITVQARGALHLAQYKAHAPLLALDVDAHVADLTAKQPGLAELAEKVTAHSLELTAMEEHLEGTVNLGLVQISCSKVREALLRKKGKLVGLLKALVAKTPRSMMATASAQFSELEHKISAKPASIEELDMQRRLMAQLPDKVAPLQAEIDAAKHWYVALEGMRYLLPDDDAREKLTAQSWQLRLIRQADKSLEALDLDQARFAEDLKLQQQDFAATIDDLAAAVSAVQQQADITALNDMAAKVAGLQGQLLDALAEAARFNTRETMVSWQATDYTQLSQLVKAFEPFQWLWQAAADFKAQHKVWMTEPVSKLQGEDIEQAVRETHTTLCQAKEGFIADGHHHMSGLTEQFKAEVEAFQPLVPLLKALSSPGIAVRHWEQLSTATGLQLQPDQSLTMEAAIQHGLLQHFDVIVHVAEDATQEHALEQDLNLLRQHWDAVTLTILQLDGSDTTMIQVDEVLLQKLQESLDALAAMDTNPHKQPVADRIAQLQETLQGVNQTLQQWMRLQQSWLDLLPIFGAHARVQPAPLDSKRFATVDKALRKILEAASRSCGLIKMFGNAKLHDQLLEHSKVLEALKKGVVAANCQL